MPSSSGIPESSIVFFTGGHDHDGISSGLIKTNQYSIYDWEIGVTVGNGQRGQKQSENAAGFRLLIDSIVKETTLGPAGIRLSPNTITGLHIASNTITANELSANIILVNNIIRSNNFDGNVAANGSITSVGTVGWAIAGDGTAVFDSSYIRGAIIANSVSTPGIDILSNGAIVSNNFNVDPSGNITATNATISGTITASEVSTPGVEILSNGTLVANSYILYGNGAIVTSDGNFSVDEDGYVYANGASLQGNIVAVDGFIGNWTITATDIYNDTGLANTILGANGFISAGTLKIGNNDISDAEDIVATNIIRGGRLEATTKAGVVYTGTQANSNSVGDFGFSFYYNGTNVYARLTDTANNSHFDICLTTCGTGTTSAPQTTTAAPGGGGETTTPAPATTTPAPATTTSTAAPGCGPSDVCGPSQAGAAGTLGCGPGATPIYYTCCDSCGGNCQNFLLFCI